MTWAQFKAWVDAQLAEHGAGENVPIWYIDISFPSADDIEKERIGLAIDEISGLAIS